MPGRAKPYRYPGRFMFFGEAIAFGARLDHPPVADARAVVALPSVGGRVFASHGGYVLDGGFIRFDSAASEVVSEVIGPAHTTRATTQIRNFTMAEVIEIPELLVSMKSTHRNEYDDDPEIHIQFVAPQGIRLTGPARKAKSLNLTVWERCNRDSTFKSTQVAFAPKGTAKAALTITKEAAKTQRLIERPPGRKALGHDTFSVWALNMANGRPCLPWKSGDVDDCLAYRRAEGIRLFFGELVVSKGRRRFAAVRVEFERSPASQVIVGETSVNGSRMP